MANKYLEIRDHINSILDAVEGVGITHGRARLAIDWAKYILLFRFAAKNQIRGWEITRGSVREHLRGAYFRHHSFVLRGHLSFNDEGASDEEWQPLLDEICAAFRNVQAPGAATWWYGNGDQPSEAPPQVLINDIRIFGSVLCHHAEIHISVTERIVP